MTSEMYCPVCAAVVTAGAGYCGNCGSRLSDEVAAPRDVAEEAPSPAGVMGIDYAGFWMRFLAFIADAILLIIVAVLVDLVVEARATQLVILGLIFATYSIGFWVAADGATPGKMAMGIRVVRSNGEPIGVGAAMLRCFGYCVSFILLLVGFLMIGFTPQKRALHDYIAQTVVVRVR